jgi:FkbM family methyltransferase
MSHPLTRRNPAAGFLRLAKWQIESRLQPIVEVPWVGGAKLLVSKGMTGATGNIYCGLHEFADMGFLLHLLRKGDLFVDVGANIGSYTVLASAVIGATTIAAEPDPVTMAALKRNIEVNGIGDRVTTIEAAIGKAPGFLRFTVGLDTINHVATDTDQETREVSVRTLDDVTNGTSPVFLKMDVEGFEDQVIAGATELLKNGSLLAVATETDSEPVIAALLGAGFARKHYDPFTRVLSDESVHQHSNALFIREIEDVQARLNDAPALSVRGVQL